MLDAYYSHQADQYQKAEDARLKREKYKGKTAEEVKAMKAKEKELKLKEQAAKKKEEAAKKKTSIRPQSAKPKNVARERA